MPVGRPFGVTPRNPDGFRTRRVPDWYGLKVVSDCVWCIFFDPLGAHGARRAAMSTDGAARGLIMVIEDESAIADVIRMNLAKAGYGVHIERDGISGLAAIRALKPAAVILDI
jgi:hypothetical protein